VGKLAQQSKLLFAHAGNKGHGVGILPSKSTCFNPMRPLLTALPGGSWFGQQDV
jgi:hypothetical protein